MPAHANPAGKHRRFFIIVFLLFCVVPLPAIKLRAQGTGQPVFSSAGFFSVKNSGRTVVSMNPAWRFQKGDFSGAHLPEYDDSNWQVVSLPHGTDILPEEGSGGVNYQGIVWYRKHFTPEPGTEGKKLILHFEAIMGKSEIWLNGTLLRKHYGGFLPVVVDITEEILHGRPNLLAVKADNSDDPSYPPGKAQDMLDFAYFGGIYRDCWLVSHNRVYITDTDLASEEAGGGLFISFDDVSDARARINLKLHLRNESGSRFRGKVTCRLEMPGGNTAAEKTIKVVLPADGADHFNVSLELGNPALWSPEKPFLYHLVVSLSDGKGRTVDGFMQRTGIRSIEFRGSDGFWLNGKPRPHPVIGVNRHQDFAEIGNALPNSVHWRDAKKIKDAGFDAIRNAHYPQDPAFMDACDALGLLVIVNTPGWQFWNEDPVFGERIFSDIRRMIRRDRNHASVWMWEPVLNETWYPEDFARQASELVKKEYPYPYCWTVCDAEAPGSEHFPVLYAHPFNGDRDRALQHTDPGKSYFTREWGDNVDDWNSHNSPSRVHRSWGESAMLVQAVHYASPPYVYTSLNTLHQVSRQHAGGCLWHVFDHNRGYHPDPFYGGIMDAYRQPKTSAFMFRSQRSAEVSGPMVFIAHEMTPFSSGDVTVYSNCESVRLTFCQGGKTTELFPDYRTSSLPHPPLVFRDAYNFMADKERSMNGRPEEVFLEAEGLIGGNVVATHRVMPARRPAQLLLFADDEGIPLRADGSDLVTVIAAITDENGTIKRLNNASVKFEIEGEGSLVNGKKPVRASWGTAPVLVRAGLRPGPVKLRASVTPEGTHTPVSAVLEIKTEPSQYPLLYDEMEARQIVQNPAESVKEINPGRDSLKLENERLRRELNQLKLKEVERQQKEFGEKPE